MNNKVIRGLDVGQVRYLERQKKQDEEYEARCRHCGACCGVKDSDPCINLIKDGDDKYFCKAYDNRIGQQVTVSGKSFSCIPIRVFLQFNPPYSGCAYNNRDTSHLYIRGQKTAPFRVRMNN